MLYHLDFILALDVCICYKRSMFTGELFISSSYKKRPDKNPTSIRIKIKTGNYLVTTNTLLGFMPTFPLKVIIRLPVLSKPYTAPGET